MRIAKLLVAAVLTAVVLVIAGVGFQSYLAVVHPLVNRVAGNYGFLLELVLLGTAVLFLGYVYRVVYDFLIGSSKNSGDMS